MYIYLVYTRKIDYRFVSICISTFIFMKLTIIKVSAINNRAYLTSISYWQII